MVQTVARRNLVLAMAEGGSGNSMVRISPLAAKMAAAQGIDLGSLPAIRGRIMAAHIAAAAAAHATKAGCSAPSPERRVPMSGMRKAIAARMRESAAISPTVSFDITVDITAQKRAQDELSKNGVQISSMDIIVKAVSTALLEHPNLNSTVDGDHIIRRDYVNMGITVALDDGLLVPVLNNSHAKTLAQISSEIQDLTGKARNGTLSPDALNGGTFTIFDLGMFDIESFTPIINQPHVAILGVNKITDTPLLINGHLSVRQIMKLSLTADHRAVDGALAAMFLSTLKRYLEQPALIA